MPKGTEDVIFVRTDEELKAALVKAAEEEDLTISQLVRRILRQWLASRKQRQEREPS